MRFVNRRPAEVWIEARAAQKRLAGTSRWITPSPMARPFCTAVGNG